MSAVAARASGHRWGRVTALVSTAVIGLVLTQALPAEARGGSFDDQEVVQLTHTGQVRGAGGLEVHMTARNAVRATNAAVATTRCDDCRATAVSFQVVIADRGPTSIDVGNLAYAANDSCARCDAVAVAYQFVLAYGTDVQLTATGRRALENVDAALRQLARSDLPVADVQARSDAYAGTVLDILASEVHVRATLRKQVKHVTGPGRDG